MIVFLTDCQRHSSSIEYGLSRKFAQADSIMKGVDAYIISIHDNDRHLISISGKNSSGNDVDSLTIFEGASISKTVFAYLFWKMSNDHPELKQKIYTVMCSGKNVGIDPLRLLRHSITSTDSCITDMNSDSFRYSENNYLLLQKMLEKITGNNLKDLAQSYVFKPLGMNHSDFIWDSACKNFVDGHYEKGKLHRQIRHFLLPQSNGTLYTCSADMDRFAQELLRSEFTDWVIANEIPVHNYKNLSWGNGMGIDRSTGSVLFWQWGCNWSYNHLLIIDKSKHRTCLALSNSILGAKKLRECFNYLYSSELELFNYINWY